jgi:cell division protein ZapA
MPSFNRAPSTATSKNTSGSISKDHRRLYEFEIAGMPYKIKSSHDEKTVRDLVQFVENRVNQAMDITKSRSLQSAAILAALNIAEELVLLQRQVQGEIEVLEEKALKLIDSIEQSKVPTTGKTL